MKLSRNSVQRQFGYSKQPAASHASGAFVDPLALPPKVGLQLRRYPGYLVDKDRVIEANCDLLKLGRELRVFRPWEQLKKVDSVS
jgi:hypothetical protein